MPSAAPSSRPSRCRFAFSVQQKTTLKSPAQSKSSTDTCTRVLNAACACYGAFMTFVLVTTKCHQPCTKTQFSRQNVLSVNHKTGCEGLHSSQVMGKKASCEKLHVLQAVLDMRTNLPVLVQSQSELQTSSEVSLLLKEYLELLLLACSTGKNSPQ